jgi:hypothetical protein
VNNRIKIITILLSSSLIFALLFLNKRGAFKNPIIGTLILLLILLAYPIGWRIKEYIKKKCPNMLPVTKCAVCGFEIPDDTNCCGNCGKVLEDKFAIEDEFEEDVKEKKICPYCGLKELETIYEISRGYREVCASCGKSRVSRKAIKITLYVLAYLAGIGLLFYFLLITQSK